jgi:hypothetical protein
VTVTTSYSFAPGRITRTDLFVPQKGTTIADARIEFASFSQGARVQGGSTAFATGDVRRFAVTGLARCTAGPTEGREAYRSPQGPMHSLVSCQGVRTAVGALRISWTLEYQ